MQDFSDVQEIRVLSDPEEVNNLIKNGWRYSRATVDRNRFLFLMERCFYKSLDEFRGACG